MVDAAFDSVPRTFAGEAAFQLVEVGALTQGAFAVVHDAERDAQVSGQPGRVPRLTRDGHARHRGQFALQCVQEGSVRGATRSRTLRA